MPDNSTNQPKDVWTKAMFGVLVFFGVSALILGILQIGQGLNLSGGWETSANQMDGSQWLGETKERSIEDLKNTDTDGDGLSDFEELYIYNTSMYLADSDSDGYTDKEEIDGGYDPNCPKGQDCRGISADTSQELRDSYSQGLMPISPDNYLVEQDQLPPEAIDQLKQLTAPEIRQLILESGQMTAEQLGQIDDATLVQMFQEVIAEQE